MKVPNGGPPKVVLGKLAEQPEAFMRASKFLQISAPTGLFVQNALEFRLFSHVFSRRDGCGRWFIARSRGFDG